MTELAKYTSSNLPAHMQEDAGAGKDEIKKNMRPGFVKIVQKTSKDEMVDAFGVGGVIVSPTNVLLATPGDSFEFAVQFFYKEWIAWVDMNSGGRGLPPFVGRTTDPNDPIALNAMDPAKRQGVIETDDHGAVEVKYREHLNFIVSLDPATGVEAPVVLGFSAGEYRTGKKFIDLIGSTQVPLWGMRYKASVPEKPRSNELGSWYGLDITQAGIIESVDEYAALKEGHLVCKEMFEKNAIQAQVDGDVDKDEEEPVAAGSRPDDF